MPRQRSCMEHAEYARLSKRTALARQEICVATPHRYKRLWVSNAYQLHILGVYSTIYRAQASCTFHGFQTQTAEKQDAYRSLGNHTMKAARDWQPCQDIPKTECKWDRAVPSFAYTVAQDSPRATGFERTLSIGLNNY